MWQHVFRTRFNNYKSGAKKVSDVYINKCNVYQEQFHRHFNYDRHNEMEDWKITGSLIGPKMF